MVVELLESFEFIINRDRYSVFMIIINDKRKTLVKYVNEKYSICRRMMLQRIIFQNLEYRDY